MSAKRKAATPSPQAVQEDEHIEEELHEGAASDGEDELEPQRRNGFAPTLFHTARDDDDTMNSTRTLHEGDVEYTYIHGRRYCGQYFMPNDQDEQDRLQLMHNVLYRLLGDKYTVVPLSNPTKILDIGTGTGEWAMAIADEYPQAEVIGTDLAPIQETSIPLNVFFEISDAEEELGWAYKENDFDLVHIRGLEGAFTSWAHIYKEAYKHLKPGGWIEVLDFDDHSDLLSFFGDDLTLRNWIASVQEGQAKLGRVGTKEHLDAQNLTSLGYVDVQQTNYKLPIGLGTADSPALRAAKHALFAQLHGVQAYSLRPLAEIGWSLEKIEAMVSKVKQTLGAFAKKPECADALSVKIKVLTGRKPMGGESSLST